MFSKLYSHKDGRQIARDARITPPDRETMVRGSFMAPLMLSRLTVGGRGCADVVARFWIMHGDYGMLSDGCNRDGRLWRSWK